MASNGIRDRVAIVGMGCTPFGEHWDKPPTTSWSTPRRGPDLGRHRADEVDAYWLGTMVSGQSGLTLSRPLKIDYKPVTRRRELLRHRLGGVPQRLLRRGRRRLRRRHGDRGREAQGLRLLRPARQRWDRRRHRGGALRARHLQPAGAGLREEVRRRRGAAQGGDDAHRLEEPQERRAQRARPVPQGGVQGEDRLLADRGGRARHLRLLGRLRRRRRGADRPRRGRPPVHREPDVREGAVVRRRPGGGADRPRLRLHDLPRGRRLGRGRLRAGRDRATRARRSRWPRCTTASPRPSWS